MKWKSSWPSRWNKLSQLLLPCRSVKAEAAHLALSCSLSTASRWGCGRIKHKGELAYVLQSFRLLLAFLHLLFSLIGLLQAMVTHKKKKKTNTLQYTNGSFIGKMHPRKTSIDSSYSQVVTTSGIRPKLEEPCTFPEMLIITALIMVVTWHFL